MKRLGTGILIFLIIITLSLPMHVASAEASAVSVTLALTGAPYKGNTVTAIVTVSKPSVPLEGLELALGYDPAYVSPVITENSEENPLMDVFASNLPNGWEQMHRLDTDNNEYELRFVCGDDGSALDAPIVLEIPFTVLGAGSFCFDVSDKSILAVGADENLTLYGGTGSSLDVTALEGDSVLLIDLKQSEAVKGCELMLDVEVTNLGDTQGIVGLELELAYDDTVLPL